MEEGYWRKSDRWHYYVTKGTNVMSASKLIRNNFDEDELYDEIKKFFGRERYIAVLQECKSEDFGYKRNSRMIEICFRFEKGDEALHNIRSSLEKAKERVKPLLQKLDSMAEGQ